MIARNMFDVKVMKLLSEQKFQNFVKSLSEDDKSKLIASFIMCKCEVYSEILEKPFSQAGLDASFLPVWTKPVVLQLIMIVLDVNNISPRILSPDISARILKHAMQMIPDTFLSIDEKRKICELISPSLVKKIDRYAYHESVKPLALYKAESKGKIKDSEILKIRGDHIDISEFILLCRGVFSNKLEDPKNKEKLDEVLELYQSLKYDEAVVLLEQIMYQNISMIGKEVFNYFKKLLRKNISPVVSERNYSRRFYENRLAQYYLGDVNLDSFNKISHQVIGIEVKTHEQVLKAVMDIFNEWDPGFMNRYGVLSALSQGYKRRKRKLREHFDYDESGVGKLLGEKVYSRNPGLMVSMQPALLDELTHQSLRNKVVDKYRLDSKDSYAPDRMHAAYAASISGHTFYMVAVLESYMEKNSKDPMLSQDIHNYIKAFIGSYVGAGYHGFHEVLDVFHEPHILKIFEKYNVFLNLKCPEKILQQAAADTQEYTKNICSKRSLHSELLEEKRQLRKYKKMQVEELHKVFCDLVKQRIQNGGSKSKIKEYYIDAIKNWLNKSPKPRIEDIIAFSNYILQLEGHPLKAERGYHGNILFGPNTYSSFTTSMAIAQGYLQKELSDEEKSQCEFKIGKNLRKNAILAYNDIVFSKKIHKR